MIELFIHCRTGMDERSSSEDDESFELVDSIDVETAEYVFPDLPVEGSITGSDPISENRPDSQLVTSSLHQCHKTSSSKNTPLQLKVKDKRNVEGRAGHDLEEVRGYDHRLPTSKLKAGISCVDEFNKIHPPIIKGQGHRGQCNNESCFYNFNHFKLATTSKNRLACSSCAENHGNQNKSLTLKTDDVSDLAVLHHGTDAVCLSCNEIPVNAQKLNLSDQPANVSNQHLSHQPTKDSKLSHSSHCQKCSDQRIDGNMDQNLDLNCENCGQSSITDNTLSNLGAKEDPHSRYSINKEADRPGALHQFKDIPVPIPGAMRMGQNGPNSSFKSEETLGATGIAIEEEHHGPTPLLKSKHIPHVPGSAVRLTQRPALHLECGVGTEQTDQASDGPFSPTFKREKPLCKEEFLKLFDQDGRIVDEHALRKAVFMGGVDPSIRKDVWHFLFGLFPCSSTTREREDLLIDYIMKYHEQKSRWKTMLMLSAKPGASLLEQGLVARYQIDTSNKGIRSPDGDINDPINEFEMLQSNLRAGKMKSGNPDFRALSKNFPDLDIESPELKQKIDFMKIQAQVLVNRHNINMRNFWSQLRVVDKDVPRTDRDHEYFRGQLNPNLTVLREILLTFSAFYPKIGYAQGMNDILARFLVVFDSEVETYWCFANYMSKIQEDFTEDGMVRKIELVVELLEEMDQSLLNHLRSHDLGDLMFCHRWLLLGFKREMSFIDSLRCFEILSSHHLELSSLEAENARRKQTMKEFENLGGITRTARLDTECEYTFELFMCLALLEECRAELLQCTDTAAVFTVINNIKIDLDDILCKAADLFYQYCKKSVDDSFLMVELPSSNRKQKTTRR